MQRLSNYVVIDFETNGKTGADGKWDTASQSPTEVAVVRVVDGEVTSTFNTLIYYDGEWTPHLASPANHHTADELRKGMYQRTVAEILWQFLAGDDIVVAYNALFDLEVAYRLFQQEFGGDGEDFPYNVDFLDPLTIARDRHPYPHKLGDMCKTYGIELADAHLALDDALALVQLVEAMQSDPKHPEGIAMYKNVAGYKRQYGVPLWTPRKAILKPQGNETVYHGADGSESKQKPARKVVPHARKPTIVESTAVELAKELEQEIEQARQKLNNAPKPFARLVPRK